MMKRSAICTQGRNNLNLEKIASVINYFRMTRDRFWIVLYNAESNNTPLQRSLPKVEVRHLQKGGKKRAIPGKHTIRSSTLVGECTRFVEVVVRIIDKRAKLRPRAVESHTRCHLRALQRPIRNGLAKRGER